MTQFDDRLAALRAAEPDGDLSQVESAVWSEIGELRRQKEIDARAFPVRAAAVVAALGLGAIVGGAQGAALARSERPEISAFQVSLALAPSTLLEGR